MAESRNSWFKAVIVGVVVIGLAWLLCKVFGICPFCPGEEIEPPSSAAAIILEDMHAGAWMALENGTFEFGKAHSHSDDEADFLMPEAAVESCESPEQRWGSCGVPVASALNDTFDTNYRHGLLFQMGYDVVPPKPLPPAAPGRTDYAGVLIRYSDDTELWLDAAVGDPKFDWLDIRVDTEPTNPPATRPSPLCVIDPATAYKMFVNNVSPATCPVPDVDPDYHCTRVRSIHAAVEAHRLITFWSGPDNYDVVVGRTDEIGVHGAGKTHGKSHVSYKFEVGDTVLVDHWLKGCRVDTYRDIKEIRILYDDGASTHNGFKHRPMNG